MAIKDSDRAPLHVAIIGAGPAGLTAAYLLAQQQIDVSVFEADEVYVGGISRTVKYKGFRFDIGGHRFFSKSKEIEELWKEMLPGGWIKRSRSSRIYYKNQFFSYPLKPFEAFFRLGVLESILCVVSYLKVKFFPHRNVKNFEQWVSNRFGHRLFSIFFRTYTEKVWGMKCKDISSDWAAQRIKDLSLVSAILNAFGFGKKKVIKTLIDTFIYPRLGPGMLWEECAKKVLNLGGMIYQGCPVKKLRYDSEHSKWKVTSIKKDRTELSITADCVISSTGMRELCEILSGQISLDLVDCARALRYRDFITVGLIAKEPELFFDHWIYIHDPSVKVGRIQNFKRWSPEMVADSTYCSYGLEYFCFEGDGLWESSNKQLIERAKEEMEKLGFGTRADFVDGVVIRQRKAYPVYDHGYQKTVLKIRSHLEERYPSLHLIGRNGMHMYNNQDHAMMTARLCVKNILAKKPLYDLWQVNQDAEYIEAGVLPSTANSPWSGGRDVPTSTQEN